jgi:hypothetical protein
VAVTNGNAKLPAPPNRRGQSLTPRSASAVRPRTRPCMSGTIRNSMYTGRVWRACGRSG